MHIPLTRAGHVIAKVTRPQLRTISPNSRQAITRQPVNNQSKHTFQEGAPLTNLMDRRHRYRLKTFGKPPFLRRSVPQPIFRG